MALDGTEQGVADDDLHRQLVLARPQQPLPGADAGPGQGGGCAPAGLGRLGLVAPLCLEQLRGRIDPVGPRQIDRLDAPVGDQQVLDVVDDARTEPDGGRHGAEQLGDVGAPHARVEAALARLVVARTERSCPEGARAERPGAEGPCPEGACPEGPGAEGSRPEGPRSEGPGAEGPCPEGPRSEGPRSEGPLVGCCVALWIVIPGVALRTHHCPPSFDGRRTRQFDRTLVTNSGPASACASRRYVVAPTGR